MAYLSYLAMLGSSVAQLSASVVHDYFNRRSLVVASAADGPGYRIWGDRRLLKGGAGPLAAAHCAQASRQAIDDLLETGETDITIAPDFREHADSRRGPRHFGAAAAMARDWRSARYAGRTCSAGRAPGCGSCC